MPVFLLLLSFAFAEDLWAVAPVDGVRWPDATAVSVKLAAGDEVEVMVKDADKVRVRKGADFGWVPATALTDVAPAKTPDAGAPEEGEDFPTVNIPDGQEVPAGGAPASAPAPGPGSAPASAPSPAPAPAPAPKTP